MSSITVYSHVFFFSVVCWIMRNLPRALFLSVNVRYCCWSELNGQVLFGLSMIMNWSPSCSFTYSTSWRTFGSSIVVSWTLLVKLQHTRSSVIDGNYLLKYCEVMFSFSSSWFAGKKLKTSDRLDFSLIPRKSKVVRLLRCTPKSMKSFRLSWSR